MLEPAIESTHKVLVEPIESVPVPEPAVVMTPLIKEPLMIKPQTAEKVSLSKPQPTPKPKLAVYTKDTQTVVIETTKPVITKEATVTAEPEPVALMAETMSSSEVDQPTNSPKTTTLEVAIPLGPPREQLEESFDAPVVETYLKLVALEETPPPERTEPLEQTFVELISYFSAAEELPEPEQAELIEIVNGIKIELAACYVSADGEEPVFQLTPELTEKLLTLVETLGYEQPQEVLTKFVAEYGLESLVEALEHICQLVPAYDPEEFLKAAAVPHSNPSSAQQRIGRALLGLIAKVAFEPSVY